MAARKKDAGLVNVMGRRWDTSRPNLFTAPAGLSLDDLVSQSLEQAYKDNVYTKAQHDVLRKYARCRWNGMEVARENWKRVFPEKGDRIEILHGVRGGGGGGGKNPIATILSVVIVAVATVATFWAGGAGGAAAAAAMGVTTGQLSFGIGLVAAGMLMAVNALFPASPPSLGGLESGSVEKESQTYSINGGKNAHNVNGYVPLVLGRHRLTPPLGAKSWTQWKGDDQYFNMLVVWGHPDITVSDFRIGETPLSNYADVEHHFIQSTTGGGLKFFAKQYTEESVGAKLERGVDSKGKAVEVKKIAWTQRTVGECNEISVDISFPSGLTKINKNNGDKERREIEIEVQYKPTASKTWKKFSLTTDLRFSSADLQWTLAEMNDSVSVFYKDGKLSAVLRGQTVSGGIQIFPRPQIKGSGSRTGMAYMYGCGVTVEPDGAKLKVTVAPGVFKWNNRQYAVGGGKTSSYGYWDDVYGFQTNMRVTGKDTVLTIDSPIVIGVNSSGKVVKGAGIAKLYPVKASGVSGGGVTWSKTSRSYYNYYDSDEWGYPRSSTYYSYWQASVKSGTAQIQTTTGKTKIGAAQQKQVVRSFTQSGLPLKSYDVRMRRLTADSSDSYIIDGCEWATSRAIIDKPAFDTPVPICVSELRIRASEQLSGYVTEFSGMCVSHIPDWTKPVYGKDSKGKTVLKTAGHWNTKRDTSNPASIMRYLLTSRHSLIKPFSASRLDNAAIVRLWQWCKDNEFEFNFVCDSEENLWSRLMEVLAPALAAPTTDVDGLWGAIYDAPGKTPRQLFTPRNSWGLSIQRGFARLPDALRVSYVDEEDGYVTKEGFVYNDGYNKDGSGGKKKANDVVEWSFPGVTSWKKIHKLGRYHLAQMLHRQMTLTLSTDWEWLAVHRGDLVGVASDVLMNTFGTARIMAKLYKVNANAVSDRAGIVISEQKGSKTDATVEVLYALHEAVPAGAQLIGIQIDDTVVFSAPKPARYGIAIRKNAAQAGASSALYDPIEIVADYEHEDSVLRFKNPAKIASAKINPAIGSLVAVSLLKEEYEEYLVSSVTPGDNMSAQLTLVPYKTTEIMKAANGKIPDYDVPVILDVVRGATSLPTPTVRASGIRSDESAAILSASGAVIICINVPWSVKASSDLPEYFTAELRCTDTQSGRVITGTGTSSTKVATAENAVEGRTYTCQIRLHDPATGRTSGWSTGVDHKVAGLVARPPAPKNVKAVASYPEGVVLTWDAVDVIDLRYYEIFRVTQTNPLKEAMLGQSGKTCRYAHKPEGLSGKLTYDVYSWDTTKHRSERPGSASIQINPPSAPTITFARLQNEGVSVRFTENAGTWPVDRNEFECPLASGTTVKAQAPDSPVVLVPPASFVYTDLAEGVRGRSRDAFKNWSASWSAYRIVEIVPPKTPEPDLGVTSKGQAAFKWQDCRTVTDIARYEIQGSVNGSVSGRNIEISVSETLWNNVRIDEGHGTSRIPGQVFKRGWFTATVTAYDKWGVPSAPGSCEAVLESPRNPVLAFSQTSDNLYLKWQDCKTTFDIKHYIVEDPGTGQKINVNSTSWPVSPRAKGTHSFAVTAVDAIGSMSARMESLYYFDGVGMISQPSAEIEGANVKLTWQAPTSTWPIIDYEVADGSGAIVGKSKTNVYRFPAPRGTGQVAGSKIAGTYEWGVRAIDAAGNLGEWGVRAALTIYNPAPPEKLNASVEGTQVVLTWTPKARANSLTIVGYDVVRQWYEPRTDGEEPQLMEQDYGRVDATTLTVPALPAMKHWFMVRAVDAAGNRSETWAEAEFTVKAPGEAMIVSSSVVDNNVLLYWAEPRTVFFPIEYYLFESVQDGLTAVLGRIDARFASTFEEEAGEYRYRVTPVDCAGNMGPHSEMTVRVTQPPNFVLYHNLDSTLNGAKTNFLLDGRGKMLGPYANETWQQNIASAGLTSNSTWQDKVNAGHEHWLDPGVPSATYVEIVDVGAIVHSTAINVTMTTETLTGTPVWTCRIETSPDRTNWTVAAQNSFAARGEEFRYCRYTIGVSGGTVAISNINYKLSVTEVTDGGTVTAPANVNDSGWTSMEATPMKTGVWVSFHKAFIDIDSLTVSVVASADYPNVAGYQAYAVFVDDVHPEGFRVFVLNKNGVRVSAKVAWSAHGV